MRGSLCSAEDDDHRMIARAMDDSVSKYSGGCRYLGGIGGKTEKNRHLTVLISSISCRQRSDLTLSPFATFFAFFFYHRSPRSESRAPSQTPSTNSRSHITSPPSTSCHNQIFPPSPAPATPAMAPYLSLLLAATSTLPPFFFLLALYIYLRRRPLPPLLLPTAAAFPPSPKTPPNALPAFPAPASAASDPCPICLDPLSTAPVSAAACAHYAHAPCLASWLATGDATCPICRHPFAAPAAPANDCAVGVL